MRLDHAVQHAVRGVTRLIRGRVGGHAADIGAPRPDDNAEKRIRGTGGVALG
jgi:hypothetical protein